MMADDRNDKGGKTQGSKTQGSKTQGGKTSGSDKTPGQGTGKK